MIFKQKQMSKFFCNVVRYVGCEQYVTDNNNSVNSLWFSDAIW